MLSANNWIAHRGYQLHYPENSAASIHAALACGAQWIEIDVQLSADYVPIIIHDATTARISNSKHCVLTTPWQQLQHVANGEPQRFGTQFGSSRLMPLMELADLVAPYPTAQCFIELKKESINHFGAARCLTAVYQALQPIIERCILISFDYDALAQADPKQFPRIAPVLSSWPQRNICRQHLPRAEMLLCNYRKIADDLFQCHVPLAVYEVADFQLAQALYARGATLIETFAIGEMLTQSQCAMQTTAD